jgi:hypothetical protein
MNRFQAVFGVLVLAQAAHSVEEYVGRLWESFPPARFVSGLTSPGVATAPVLFVLALYMAFQLRHVAGA